jgi:Uma2 family endonuclease
MIATAPMSFVYTEDDLRNVPEDGCKYELVQGELTRVPTFFEHDLISSILLSYLLPIAQPLGFVTTGQAGVRMRSGNVRVPDVSFTRRERIREVYPRPGFGTASPDLCVEIISDSESPGDIEEKVVEYFASGAICVWHLLPETRQVRVFDSPFKSAILAEADELEGGSLLPGFHVRVGDLFSLGLD